MTIGSLAILVEIVQPSATIRLWDGVGPFVADGETWLGGHFGGLDEIELVLNGEASGFALSVSGVSPEVVALSQEEYEDGEVIDATVRVMIQPRDENDQPVGDLRVHFTGRVDNWGWEDFAGEDGITSTISVEVVNRFDLRNLPAGGTLTDADQRLRSPTDAFCERVTGLSDKTLSWPNFPPPERQGIFGGLFGGGD